MTRYKKLFRGVVSVALATSLSACSEAEPSAEQELGEGGAKSGDEPSGDEPSGSDDPCAELSAAECKTDERCQLATTFDCEAWKDITYCVGKEVDCEPSSSSRGVALSTNASLVEGQCYDFEERCYTGRFRAPEDAECEVCDY